MMSNEVDFDQEIAALHADRVQPVGLTTVPAPRQPEAYVAIGDQLAESLLASARAKVQEAETYYAETKEFVERLRV
jgi:hypothetical protein